MHVNDEKYVKGWYFISHTAQSVRKRYAMRGNETERNGTADLIAPLQPASWPIPTGTTGGTTPARVFRAEWWRDKRVC